VCGWQLKLCDLLLTNTVLLLHTQHRLFYGPLSWITRVSRYRKKHSPIHHPEHHPIFISFFHLPQSIASSFFKLRAWQSFWITSLHVLFGLPLGLEPSTSYSIHFFTQSVSSFHSTCPYHRNLFCCNINSIWSIPSLSLNSLLGTLSFTLTLHIHLTILISAHWSATSLQHAQCSHCKGSISYGNSVCLSVCLSVCPSVRPSHASIVSKRRHVARCSLHHLIAKCV